LELNFFLLGDHENIRLWNKDAGFDMTGLDYLIKTRWECEAHNAPENNTLQESSLR
jgi:hypothetical protein